MAVGQHALPIRRERVKDRLDDRLDSPLPDNLGDSLREGCQPGGGAGDEDAGLAGHVHATRLENRHSEQAALIAIIVELPNDFPRRELMHRVVGVSGEFVLDGAENVLDAELGAEALDEF